VSETTKGNTKSLNFFQKNFPIQESE